LWSTKFGLGKPEGAVVLCNGMVENAGSLPITWSYLGGCPIFDTSCCYFTRLLLFCASELLIGDVFFCIEIFDFELISLGNYIINL